MRVAPHCAFCRFATINHVRQIPVRIRWTAGHNLHYTFNRCGGLESSGGAHALKFLNRGHKFADDTCFAARGLDERVVNVSSNAPETPALDDLQNLAEPAWLWDAGRFRIVWSNPAGLNFFGAETMFDLIDRRFGASEHGVARISELHAELEPGRASNEILMFPSSATSAALICVCHSHQLPDGRDGILVIGQSSAAGDVELEAENAILEALPQAIMVLSPGGAILLQNQAVGELFETAGTDQLDELILEPGLANQIAARTLAAGTLSLVEKIKCRYGARDLRLYAQVLGKGGSRQILLMMEDVTDRRVLERRLREHASHLSDFVAAAADFTWELDASYAFSHVSEGFISTTNVQSEDVLGELWGYVSHRYGLDPHGGIGLLLDERSAWKADVTWLQDEPEQAPVDLILSAVPVFLQDGAFAGYRGIGAKVSTKEAAANIARFSEAPPAEAPSAEQDGSVTAEAGEAQDAEQDATGDGEPALNAGSLKLGGL